MNASLAKSLNVTEADISQFTESNTPYIKEYISDLSKVEVTQYALSTSQYEEWLREIQQNPPAPYMIKAAYEMAAYKPFPEYDKLLVNCINRIAKNEKKRFFSEDFSFKQEEVQDFSKWLARVRKSKDATVWLLTFDALVSFAKDIHDGRVAKMKAEFADKNKKL